jgi:hypothetical protein
LAFEKLGQKKNAGLSQAFFFGNFTKKPVREQKRSFRSALAVENRRVHRGDYRLSRVLERRAAV